MQKPSELATLPAPINPSEDRRQSPRYHLKLAITLRGDNNFYTGITEDLSEGGVFIATHHILPIGTPVVLQFALTRFATEISLRGKVRWIRTPKATCQSHMVFGTDSRFVKSGMGVQFEAVTPEQGRLIREFMQCRAPEFFD